MADLVTRSQVAMLAQILDVDHTELASLERLGAPAVRAVLERVSNLLFDEHAATFARISKLAPLVPTSVAAKVTMKAIPPEVGGRAGGTVGRDHPDRAAGLLAELSPTYMADAAPYLDPRAIPALVSRLPAQSLVPAAIELLNRGDYATTAMFVEHSTEELIRGFERGIDDDEGLLHTAARTYSADRLNEILRVLPASRRARILNSAIASDDDTLLAALSILARLDRELADELGTSFVEAADDEALQHLLRLVDAEDAVPELSAMIDALDDAAVRRLACIADPNITERWGAAARNDRERRALARLTTHSADAAITPEHGHR